MPVAWVVASKNMSHDIALWLEHLMHRRYQFRPNWKVNTFMVDDALVEIIALGKFNLVIVHFNLYFFYKYHTKDELNLAGGSQGVK